jgi:outer membrane protein OmpA-like peptidoglycan-associated protein
VRYSGEGRRLIMKNWRSVGLVGLLVGALAAGAAADDATQSVSGKILQVGIGARPVGMGEAMVAASDDVYSLFWNPAGLTRLGQTQITLMHNAWFGGINSEYLAYAQPTSSGGFGLGLNYINFGSFQKYGIDSNNYPVPLDESFTPITLVTTFGYAQTFSPLLALGANLKLVSESVDTYNNLTMALDLGVQAQKVWNSLDLGLMVQNAGLPIQGYSLPLNVKAGVDYNFLPAADKNKFLAAVDFNLPIPTSQPYYANAGLEYWFFNTVALRAGYKFSQLNSLGQLSGLTGGLGLRITDYTLDYAYADYGLLGVTHRVSLTAAFGGDSKKAKSGKHHVRLVKRMTSTTGGASAEGVLIPRLSGLTMRAPITVKVQCEVVGNRVQKATFDIQASPDTDVSSWALKVLDSQGRLLRKYTGLDLQEFVVWDGKDAGGHQPVETIFATYEFYFVLGNGTSDKTAGKLVEARDMKFGDTQNLPTTGRVKMEPIYFEEKSYDLSEGTTKALSRIAETLKRNPYIQCLIEGYADTGAENGEEVYLSQRRADTVVRFLTTAFKIPLSKISSHARGNKNPVAPNSTEEGRAKNRRVEITIVYSK